MNSHDPTSTDPNADQPRPSFWMKGFRYLFLGILGLITLWALFCAVENFRGHRAWQQTHAALLAQGEKLTIAELVQPVPDDQNLAFTPLFKPMNDWITQGGPRPRDSNAYWKTQSIGLPNGGSLSGWAKGEALDLDKWAASFKGHTNYPSTTNLSNKGEEILFALNRYTNELREIVAATKLPHIRFPIRYEHGADALLPHLSQLKSLSSMLSLRATARLRTGDAPGALEDTLAALRLSEGASSDLTIIGLLVQIAIESIAVQPVWEGIRQHRWTADQLARIQQRYAASDYHRGLREALRVERVMMVNHTLEGAMRNPKSFVQNGGWGDQDSDPQSGVFATVISFTPKGWIRQNQAVMNRMYQRMIDDFPEDFRQLHNVDIEKNLREISRSLHDGFLPYRVLARQFFPALHGLQWKTLRAHAVANLVQGACALERHRLKQGKYPVTLAELELAFQATLPADPYNGQPLGYAKKSDGGFVLYSVGPDRKDDGGTPIDNKKKRSAEDRSEPGDVVFTLSP